MIRRFIFVLAVVCGAFLGPGAAAFASTSSPMPAPADITQCTQVQFLGPDAVAACNLGPPKQGFISGLLNTFNAGNGVNNVCQPGLPYPENAAQSAFLAPPPVPTPQRTLESSYGASGLSWAPFNLQCSQWEDLLANTASNNMFGVAKAITSVTLTIVHAATTGSVLNGIQGTIDKAIVAVGHVAYQWSILVLVLGAAYMGFVLFAGRAREVFASAGHMLAFSVVFLVLVATPHLWTSLPAKVIGVSSQVTSDLFTAMPQTTVGCLPVHSGDPQSAGEGLTAAGHGESALWGFMACRPWLAGEFADPQVQQKYGRALLFSQSFAVGEPQTNAATDLKAKLYGGIDNEINQHYPGTVNLFEGNLYVQRFMIAGLSTLMDVVLGFMFAGLAITLLLAQIMFYFLMVASPVLVLVGTYPGPAGKDFFRRWLLRALNLLIKTAVVTVLMTGVLWAFGVLASLPVPWVVQGVLITGVGVAMIAKRKTLVEGAVRANGWSSNAAERISKPFTSDAPTTSSGGSGVGSGPVRKETVASVAKEGHDTGYKAGRKGSRKPGVASNAAWAATTGAKVAGATTAGGPVAGAAATVGAVRGKLHERRAQRTAAAEAEKADADRRAEEWKAKLSERVHARQVRDQLNGKYPEWKKPADGDQAAPHSNGNSANGNSAGG